MLFDVIAIALVIVFMLHYCLCATRKSISWQILLSLFWVHHRAEHGDDLAKKNSEFGRALQGDPTQRFS